MSSAASGQSDAPISVLAKLSAEYYQAKVFQKRSGEAKSILGSQRDPKLSFHKHLQHLKTTKTSSLKRKGSSTELIPITSAASIAFCRSVCGPAPTLLVKVKAAYKLNNVAAMTSGHASSDFLPAKRGGQVNHTGRKGDFSAQPSSQLVRPCGKR